MLTTNEFIKKHNISVDELRSYMNSCGYNKPYNSLKEVELNVLESFITKSKEVRLKSSIGVETITVKEIANRTGLSIGSIKVYITKGDIISDSYQTVTMDEYKRWLERYEFNKEEQTCAGCSKKIRGSNIHYETKLCKKCMGIRYPGGYSKPDVGLGRNKKNKINTDELSLEELNEDDTTIDYSTAQEEFQDCPDIQESFGFTQEEIEGIMSDEDEDEEDTIDLDTFELPADVKKLRDEKGFDGLLNVRRDNPDNFLDQETTDRMLDTICEHKIGITGNRGPVCGDVGVNTDMNPVGGITRPLEEIKDCCAGMDGITHLLKTGHGITQEEIDNLLSEEPTPRLRISLDPYNVRGDYILSYFNSCDNLQNIKIDDTTIRELSEEYKELITNPNNSNFHVYKLHASLTPTITINIKTEFK